MPVSLPGADRQKAAPSYRGPIGLAGPGYDVCYNAVGESAASMSQDLS